MQADCTGTGPENEQMESLGPYALTRAETRQVTAGKRDRLYGFMLRASIGFLVFSTVLMAGFKMNEDFLDANSRLAILMESLSAQENNLSHPKINVKANFRDEEKASLVIPLTASIDRENVGVREEFTRNKFVVTLSGYSDYVPDEIELVSDSTIMDAVGVYRQNHDVVVEVYCRGRYDYEMTTGSGALTLHFMETGDDYAASAVVWLPYEDRNRLALPEWRQVLDKFAADNNVKLYMAPDMREEYTQSDVIAFANEIKADMVLGVQVGQTDAQQSCLTGICNTAYFIPDYNSAHLSVVMAGVFVEQMQMDIRGFEEAGSGDPLVSEAAVPAAMVKISLTREDMESIENEYKLNQKIAASLADTMRSVLENVINTEEKGNEN